MKKTKKEDYFKGWVILESPEPTPFDNYIDALDKLADENASKLLDIIKAMDKTQEEKNNQQPL